MTIHYYTKFLIIILFILIISRFSFSCKEKKILKKENKVLLLQNIRVIYDSLAIYNLFQKYDTTKYKYNIVSYINVSCPPCLDEIDKWAEFYKRFKKRVKVNLVCYSEDYFEYFKYLYENGRINKLPYPLFFDTYSSSIKNNPHFVKNNFDFTAITDNTNKIIAVGNPLHDTKTYNLYSEICNK